MADEAEDSAFISPSVSGQRRAKLYRFVFQFFLTCQDFCRKIYSQNAFDDKAQIIKLLPSSLTGVSTLQVTHGMVMVMGRSAVHGWTHLAGGRDGGHRQAASHLHIHEFSSRTAVTGSVERTATLGRQPRGGGEGRDSHPKTDRKVEQ